MLSLGAIPKLSKKKKHIKNLKNQEGLPIVGYEWVSISNEAETKIKITNQKAIIGQKNPNIIIY